MGVLLIRGRCGLRHSVANISEAVNINADVGNALVYASVDTLARGAHTCPHTEFGGQMSHLIEVRGGECAAGTDSEPRDVVAVVLGWRGRVGLFKRSALVGHDQGLWHCITGYVDGADFPGAARRQALVELYEETGLAVADLDALEPGPVLTLSGGGGLWNVHTFSAATSQRRLALNWEHESYRWVRPSAVSRFCGRVPWLTDVLRAVESPQLAGPEEVRRCSSQAAPTPGFNATVDR
jgi:8-oxo-dGTP pyrophosphatase MutT (NUDIX family)